ncbi:hypothetical protein MTBLM5_220008 [Magnetospirillum sp. LM-5]|nr:hypothetical protein MTBLM5_220008 [Magnetospirillum sp. LM-5]
MPPAPRTSTEDARERTHFIALAQAFQARRPAAAIKPNFRHEVTLSCEADQRKVRCPPGCRDKL